jgi:glycosyltransferase involved in cell wall biosynthesis
MSSNGRRALTRLIRTGVGAFDAVLVSRPATVEVFRSICAEVPGFLESTFRIYDAEALFAPREERRRALFGYPSAPLEHERALSSELELLQGADAITAVSAADAQIFQARTSAAVHVISHKIAVDPAANGFADRRDLLFVGRLGGARDLSPNVDSLVWFVDEVMPLLDQRLGSDYRLQVVGLVASQAVEQLASERVVLNGLVDDVSALYARCRLFIAPTRFAAGIPLKVLEAFGMGIPCVVTPIVAEQIGVSIERTMLVGDDAAGFADACFSLYTDAALWNSVRTQALKQLDRDYSSAAFDDSVRALLASVGPTLEQRRSERRIAPTG